MNILLSLVSGLIFGIGLIVSGMGNPGKVLAFLDLAGSWDPSLALVMMGAIAVGVIAFYLAGKRATSLLGFKMQIPTNRIIDRRLMIGGALFGIGWGLAGICPGPALMLIGAGAWKVLIFIVAMLAGMALFAWFEQRISR